MGSSESTRKKDIEIGEEVSRSAAIYRIWTHAYPCVEAKKWKRTLFIRHFAETDSKETKAFFENGIKKLRQLRHPHIVSYKECSQSADELSLLTERVDMLDLCIDSQSPIEIHNGLTHILSALIFLHEKASLTHNNVCPSSVVIAPGGVWKLSGFECAQEMNNTNHWVQSDFVRSIKNSDFAPPEDQVMLNKDIPPTSRDAFAFGKLIAYAMPFMRGRLPTETISALEEVVLCLTDSDASKRGQLAGIAHSHAVAFDNRLSLIVDFLQTIHHKNEQQKTQFFESIIDWLCNIPQEVVGKRLVPLLLSRYVVLDQQAHRSLLPFVLTPIETDSEDKREGLFSREGYGHWVIPELLRIFRVHETSVRLALLAHFPLYVCLFSRVQLETVVLPELVIGMHDVDGRIVSASLHAMADLVPVLGAAGVTGLKHKKTFADGTPKKDGIYTPPCAVRSGTCTPIEVPAQRHGLSAVSHDSSVSPSSHLSRMFSDDEVPQTSDVRLQLMNPSDHNAMHPHTSRNDWGGTEGEEWGEDWGSQEDLTPRRSPSPDLATCQIDVGHTADIDLDNSNIEIQSDSKNNNGAGRKGRLNNERIVEEEDFFADMEPVIAQTPSLLERLEQQVKEAKGTAKSKTAHRFIAEPENEVSTDDLNTGAWEEATVSDWDAD